MRDEFEMVCDTDLGNLLVTTHEMTVAVEIEPDEHSAGANYYIARCFVEGTTKVIEGSQRKTKTGWHEVKKGHPLFPRISLYAYQYRRDELEAIWADWLNDQPRARRLRSDNELRTHGGSL